MQLLHFFRYGYGLPLATTAAALLVTLLVGVWTERTALALYLWAVVVSAYFAGIRAGFLAVGLAVASLAGQYQLLPAASPLRQRGDLLPVLTLFSAAGVLAAYLSHACRRALASAARMRHTIGHMQEAVVLTDAAGRINYLNRAARDLCGRQGAEALGQPFSWVFTLLDPKSRNALDDPAAQVLKPGSGPLAARTAVLRPRNAPEASVEFSAEPLRSHRAAPFGALVVLRAAHPAEETTPRAADPLHAVAASAPAGIVVLDPAGHCIYSNPACRIVAGIAPGEGLGDGWTRFVHKEDQEFATEWQRAVRQEKPFTTEIRFQGEGGRHRWAQLRAAPLRDETGRYLGQVGLLDDITLWKELEDDLGLHQREAEDERRKHRDQVQEIENRLVASQKSQSHLQQQLTEKEAAEQRLRRRYDDERLEWQRTEERLLRENAELLRSREALEEKLAATQDDGNSKAELDRWKAEFKQTENKLKQDLKEQRKARQAAEEALAELRRTEEARRAEGERHQADWGQARERLRKEVADLTETTQLLEAELADWQQKEKQARTALEASQRERDLGRAELEAARRRLQDELEVTRKRTQEELEVTRRRTQEELETARRRALEERELWQREQAERQQKTDWLDRVSERLQPLANDLNKALCAWHYQGDATRLRRNVLDMTRFADDLWTAGRLGRNALVLHPEPTELGSLVEGVVALASPLVEAQGHHLTIKVPLTPEWLTVDPHRTEQALVALLDNAAKYTASGGAIELSAERQGQEITFHVRDSGPGIPRERLLEIQELDARQRRFGERLGLGLPLVRGLIEEQGGRLDILSSGPGQGTSFQVHLPIQSESLPIAQVFEGPLNGEAA